MSLAAGALVVVRANEAVYLLPPVAVAVGVGGALAAAVGWAIVAWRGEAVLVAAALTGVLAIGGLLSILSVGILVVPGAIGAVLGVMRVVRRRPPEAPPLTPWLPLATVLVGIGLPAAGLVAAQQPAVSCRERGVAVHSSVFAQSRSWGASWATDGNVNESTADIGDASYRFRCAGTQLTEFEKEQR
jgi:hypothetical protein